MASPGKSMLRIAADAGRCRTRLQKLVGISCLAPDIVTSIVEGSQPPTLTAKYLLATNLPSIGKSSVRSSGSPNEHQLSVRGEISDRTPTILRSVF